MNQQPLKRSSEHLKRLIEEIVTDECNLPTRGLAFFVEATEVRGHPPEHLKVWTTLHFLQLGSPFCCPEADCHLGLWTDRLERVQTALRHRLHLEQEVEVEFVAIGSVCHAGVEFDDLGTGRPPDLDWYDIDRRDALGRTALMRAAVRGHERLVEELLEAGADPTAVDHRGRSILEQLGASPSWIRTLLEKALPRQQRA